MQTNLLSRDQFIAFVSKFRSRAKSKELEPIDMMFYSIVRGLPASRGFTPITNQRKLENGCSRNESYNMTRDRLTNLLKLKPMWIAGRYGAEFTPEIQTALFNELMN